MNRVTKFIIALYFILSPAFLQAGPARNAERTFVQPDGTTFQGRIRGDEWVKIRTTAEGNVISRNEQGWWCYGVYAEDGSVECTDYKVGGYVPAEILDASRRIPYDRLRERAEGFRARMRKANVPMLKSMRAASTSESKVRRNIVILAQFQDVRFTKTREDFERLLNQTNYNGTGSAKDYFQAQFGEDWNFTFDVSPIVTLPQKLEYYGNNDSFGNDLAGAEMAWDACKAADAYVNFSNYDNDSDNEVENIYIFYAGYDEAEVEEEKLIWAHQYYIINSEQPISGVTRLDGVRVDRYACSSELYYNGNISGIGTFCHEYAHTFGLPDFYDTDYDDDGMPTAAGLWLKTSLMDGGNRNNDCSTPPNFNCIERKLLNLSTPETLVKNRQYSLDPIHINGDCYILNTGTSGEYFMFECRSNEGWDKYIGGKGMLVYHIDENETEYISGYGNINRWESNSINANPNHQCADLIEADKRSDKILTDYSFSDIEGLFFPRRSVTSLTSDSHSAYSLWNGQSPSVSLAGITLGTDGSISFSTTGNGSSDDTVIPEVTGVSFTSYPDAILVDFASASPSAGETAVVTWKKKDGTGKGSREIQPYRNGRYSCLITGLESGNTLYEISATIYSGGIPGNPYTISVLTKKTPSVRWPYLSMPDGSRIDRSKGLVAYVVNAADAADISWFINDESMVVGSDCRVYPDNEGTLKCMITWESGKTETITKTIKYTEEQ